jgi:membrane protein implicated in regulation of membrane protease activity
MEWLIWLGAGAALLVLEVSTLAFVAAYFALGALAASLAAGLGAPLWFQIGEFAAVSVVLLLLTRPLLLRLAGRRVEAGSGAAGLPGVVGRSALVTVAIADEGSTGQIRVGGEYWSARLADGEPAGLPAGSAVEVVGLAGGVTALVRARDPVGAPASDSSSERNP